LAAGGGAIIENFDLNEFKPLPGNKISSIKGIPARLSMKVGRGDDARYLEERWRKCHIPIWVGESVGCGESFGWDHQTGGLWACWV